MSSGLSTLESYPCVHGRYGIDFANIGMTGNSLVETRGESGQRMFIGVDEHSVGVYESESMGRNSYRFIMESTCSPSGLLQVSLKTRQGSKVFPDLFARDFVISTIKHFESNGLLIQSWLAWWVPGSVNYSEFWRNHEFGGSVEESAYKTWTGRLASNLGFDRVRPVCVTDEVVQLQFIRE